MCFAFDLELPFTNKPPGLARGFIYTQMPPPSFDNAQYKLTQQSLIGYKCFMGSNTGAGKASLLIRSWQGPGRCWLQRNHPYLAFPGHLRL